MTAEVIDAHAQVQRLVLVVKMATVLEECNTTAAISCAFLWAQGLNEKDIHKEMFSVTLGCVCCVKQIFR
jgi:hypothetical protein